MKLCHVHNFFFLQLKSHNREAYMCYLAPQGEPRLRRARLIHLNIASHSCTPGQYAYCSDGGRNKLVKGELLQTETQD